MFALLKVVKKICALTIKNGDLNHVSNKKLNHQGFLYTFKYLALHYLATANVLLLFCFSSSEAMKCVYGLNPTQQSYVHRKCFLHFELNVGSV